jgi:hypothetical protein
MKKVLSTTLVLLMVLSLPVAAMAQQPAAVTKGAYLELLLNKADTDLGGKTYMDYARENGILKGNTEDNLGLEDPLTYKTAGIILSRFLGLSSLDDKQDDPAKEYAHAAEYGLLGADVSDSNSKVTPAAAERIIDDLFTNSDAAKKYVEGVNNQDTDTFRFDNDAVVRIFGNGKDIPEDITMKLSTKTEFDMATGIHQVIEGEPDQSIEQYILKDGTYQKAKDENGKERWTAIKGQAMPDLNKIPQISPDQTEYVDKSTVYRDMGETTIDGKKVRRIDTFINLNDMSFVNDVLNSMMMAQSGEEITEGQNIGDMFKGMHGRMSYYIDPETNLIQSAKMYVRMDLNQEFEISGQPVPMSSMVMSDTVRYYDYGNPDIVIELPEEANNAEVIDITEEQK